MLLESISAGVDKIKEIANSEGPEDYPPLKFGLKRVHIRISVAPIFEQDWSNGKITFSDYDNHDKIYD